MLSKAKKRLDRFPAETYECGMSEMNKIEEMRKIVFPIFAFLLLCILLCSAAFVSGESETISITVNYSNVTDVL